MSAPFIGAYSWIMLMGRNGIVTRFIENIVHTIGFAEFTMPSIYGFFGILLVLSLNLFPLVFMYVSGALKNIDNSLLEASENMGCSGLKRFFKVIIPSISTGIATGFIMAFTLSLDDFVISYFTGGTFQTLSVYINNSLKKGVQPWMLAMSGMIFIVVLLILLVVNIRDAKLEKARANKKY